MDALGSGSLLICAAVAAIIALAVVGMLKGQLKQAAQQNAAGGTLASQWKEYFYVDSLPDNVLATKAEKKVKARFGGSRREDDNVISDGSVVAVATASA